MIRTFFLTTITLIAFAANSVLCRLALGGDKIDAAGFTGIRLFSGAFILFLLLIISGNLKSKNFNIVSKKRWISSAMLFTYAAGFSFAYITLDVAAGALILFGAVQVTMLSAAILKGEHLGFIKWTGIIFALGGFIYLLLPGADTPPLIGFLFMSAAGISWGLYSLLGKKSENPLIDTGANFIFAVPTILILLIFFINDLTLTVYGVILAVISGGFASALGYYIWYQALKGLSSAQASVVQLFVPVIAAFGGVIFLSENISPRLVVSAILILGGITLVITKRSGPPES